MKQQLILLVFLSALITKVNAQDEKSVDYLPVNTKIPISFNAGLGVSGLATYIDKGSVQLGLGATLGADYYFVINKNFSISAGLQGQYFSATAVLDNNFTRSYETQLQSQGTDQTDMQFSYSLNGYQEHENMLMLTIPVMGRYSDGNLYAAAGFKLSIPVLARYKTDSYTLTTWADINGRTVDDLPQYGFGTYNMSADNGTVDLKLGCIFAVEVGYYLNLGQNHKGALSIFLDYGLNSIQKTDGKELVAYNGTGQYGGRNMLNSGSTTSPITDGLHPWMLGLKFHYFLK